MEKGSLYKVFAGNFYMLDGYGNATNNYKDKALFRNTYGLAFFIHTATAGCGYAIYFARDKRDWNLRTIFPTGRIVEEANRISIKTRYNTFVWDATEKPADDRIESLYQWVQMNGEKYIAGLNKHPGVTEYLKRGHHYD